MWLVFRGSEPENANMSIQKAIKKANELLTLIISGFKY